MRRSLYCAVCVAYLAVLLPWSSPAGAASVFADPAFQAQWEQGESLTPNIWGPLALASPSIHEWYRTGKFRTSRLVQYFAKGRMELTSSVQEGDPPQVTNGLLAREMIEGRIEIGGNGWSAFDEHALPSIPIAGDPDNPGPTYAQLGTTGKGLLQPAPSRIGVGIDAGISATGAVSAGDVGTGTGPAFIAAYDSGTRHNVPQAFAEYRDRAGLPLIGLAISEPFRATVRVAGSPRAVIIQVFERRVLTYTPDNPPAFQVEMGNIGQHYYRWRYPNGDPVPPSTATTPPTVTFTAVSSPIARGDTAQVNIQTAPGAYCSITVPFVANYANTWGFEAGPVTKGGGANWFWHVDLDTPPGEWPIEVICETGGPRTTQRTTMTVV